MSKIDGTVVAPHLRAGKLISGYQRKRQGAPTFVNGLQYCYTCEKSKLPAEFYKCHPAACIDCLRERRANWRAAHPDYNKRNRTKLQEMRAALFQVLGGAHCVRCGFTDVRALQIDHVNGDGSRERRGVRNTYTYYRKLLEAAPGTLQVLCANCNTIKRVEAKEFGSGTRRRKTRHFAAKPAATKDLPFIASEGG